MCRGWNDKWKKWYRCRELIIIINKIIIIGGGRIVVRGWRRRRWVVIRNCEEKYIKNGLRYCVWWIGF